MSENKPEPKHTAKRGTHWTDVAMDEGVWYADCTCGWSAGPYGFHEAALKTAGDHKRMSALTASRSR
jgi:hypothetical protein